MEKNGVSLIQQCQVQAFQGDPTAMRLCMERLLPPCKAPSGRFRLPAVRTAGDLVKALPAVMQAVARGQVSAQEGEAIANMEIQRRAIETELIGSAAASSGTVQARQLQLSRFATAGAGKESIMRCE